MIIDVTGELWKQFKDAGLLPENERPGRQFQLNLRALATKDLEKVKALLAAHPDEEGVLSTRRHITAWENGRRDPKNAKIATFRAFAEALADYLVNDTTRGWVFEISEEVSAWMPVEVTYIPQDRDSPASIYVGFNRIRRDNTETRSFSIDSNDIKGNSVNDVLTNQGFQKETPELLAAYDASLVKYHRYLDHYGKQFMLTTAIGWTGKNARRYNDDDESDAQQVNLQESNGGRVVHDETDELKKTTNQGSYRYSRHVRPNILKQAIDAFRGKAEASKGDAAYEGAEVDEEDIDFTEAPVKVTAKPASDKAFTVRPSNLVIRVFHLGTHVNFDLHIDLMEPYVYDTEIKSKLILPARSMRLLDTLTSELNLVQEDIVKGKSGGNLVILGGPPGTGKTLTMEVLAEAKQVPLLLVHSGLLGTTPESIEKKLREVYVRAKNWGDVVVGIDEADVFVRQRGDDVVQNAIVAIFLRTLEYQDGTIFMTTNRIDDIDDAILSRAAAVIKYTKPSAELKVILWKTLSAQFLPNLDPAVIEDLVPAIEDDLSGRDIKGILRLAHRYERVGHTLDLDTMKDVAGFRGLKVV